MRALVFAVTILCVSAAAQQAPTAEEIMAHVAANQDRADAERAHYLYTQHSRVISRKGSKVMCEEVTDHRVTPKLKGQEHTLLKLDGRVLHEDHYIHYTEFPANKNDQTDGVHIGDDKEPVKDADHGNAVVAVKETDIDLVENMRKNLTNSDSKESRDGVPGGLFPLSTRQLKEHTFKLLGTEMKNGRQTFHLSFTPTDKDEYGWKGDAWIDSQAYEPVVVRTKMSKNIPLAVRMLLGTNVPGLGFTITYAPQGPDEKTALWFPVSFGTEFKLHFLFFFSREIILSAENHDFEKTHVSTTIHGGTDVVEPTEEPAPK